ncbi:hypothetical protein H5410_021120 [Solanum commersonii]|uniref:Uncharacterized protein n=1 Tax=Solanum commersonii TaxID=4109 RepID=A0A9J5ZD32_SOLCO|nr:hypothetical protein H5410_021120 [Solanum commersonii]
MKKKFESSKRKLKGRSVEQMESMRRILMIFRSVPALEPIKSLLALRCPTFGGKRLLNKDEFILRGLKL